MWLLLLLLLQKPVRQELLGYYSIHAKHSLSASKAALQARSLM